MQVDEAELSPNPSAILNGSNPTYRFMSSTSRFDKGGDDRVENQDSSLDDLHVAWLGLYFHHPPHACCPVAAKVVPEDLFTWDGTVESDDREESQAKDYD